MVLPMKAVKDKKENENTNAIVVKEGLSRSKAMGMGNEEYLKRCDRE